MKLKDLLQEGGDWIFLKSINMYLDTDDGGFIPTKEKNQPDLINAISPDDDKEYQAIVKKLDSRDKKVWASITEYLSEGKKMTKLNEMGPREHVWDFDDAVITLYYFKFGTRNLPVRSDSELAEELIGAPLDSLKAQAANMLFWIGDQSRGIDPRTAGLRDVSNAQKKAADKYNHLKEPDLRRIVMKIIDDRDRNDNLQKAKDIKIQKDLASKQKQQKLRDIELFKKMGKDPSKMKSLGMRPALAEKKINKSKLIAEIKKILESVSTDTQYIFKILKEYKRKAIPFEQAVKDISKSMGFQQNQIAIKNLRHHISFSIDEVESERELLELAQEIALTDFK